MTSVHPATLSELSGHGSLALSANSGPGGVQPLKEKTSLPSPSPSSS